jgi:hypothetical protein
VYEPIARVWFRVSINAPPPPPPPAALVLPAPPPPPPPTVRIENPVVTGLMWMLPDVVNVWIV